MAPAQHLTALKVKLREWRALQKARLAVMRHGHGGFDPRTRFVQVASSMPRRGARSVIACHAPGRAPIALKVYSVKHRSQNQFDCLSEVASLSPQIAQPLFIAPRLGVCAIQWAGTQNVNGQLFGPDHDAALAQAGAWLARFHADTFQRNAPLAEVGFNDSLSRKKLRNPAVLQTDAHQLRARLNALLEDMGDVPVDEVLPHFDINPANLMYSPQGLLGIDRPRMGRTAAEIDVGNFLCRVMLLTLTAQIKAREGPDSLPAPDATFLAAYGVTPQRRALVELAIDRCLLQWWMALIFTRDPGQARRKARQIVLSSLLTRYGIAQNATPVG